MEKIISKDGTFIAYNRTGEGPAVILVDGAMCNSTFGPMPVLTSLLSKHFTVISYDRRGRGNSTDNSPYSPQREVEDIGELIHELNVPVNLFGMSSGALLSLMAAANNLNISKLAIYEPPFDTDETNKSPDSAKYFSEINQMLKQKDQSGAVKYFLREVAGMPAFIISIIKLFPMWYKLKANVNTLPYDLEITKSYTLQNLSSQSITVPTLVMYGGKGPEKNQIAAKAVSERLKNCKIRVLEGQTHNVSMKALAPVLVKFFNE